MVCSLSLPNCSCSLSLSCDQVHHCLLSSFLQTQGYSFRVMDDGAVSSMIAEHDAERPTLYNTQQQRDNLLVRVVHVWMTISL